MATLARTITRGAIMLVNASFSAGKLVSLKMPTDAGNNVSAPLLSTNEYNTFFDPQGSGPWSTLEIKLGSDADAGTPLYIIVPGLSSLPSNYGAAATDGSLRYYGMPVYAGTTATFSVGVSSIDDVIIYSQDATTIDRVIVRVSGYRRGV